MLKEAGTLTDVLTKLGKVLLAVKRGHFKLALKHAGFVKGKVHHGLSDNYLAWIFGIKPLVETAQVLQSSIQHAMNNPDGFLSQEGWPWIHQVSLIMMDTK